MKLVRFFVILLSTLMLCGTLPVFAEPTQTQTETPSHALALVAEENAIPESVYYYNENTQYHTKNLRPTQTVFSWINGRNNKPALQLNGKKQYLRLRTAVLNELSAFTFSTWVNLTDNGTDNSAQNQPLFTLYSNQYSYLSVYLHSTYPTASLNGPSIAWATPQNDPQIFYLPTESNTTFALPRNQWHHVTITLSETNVSLYINGNLYLQTSIPPEILQMASPKLLIGSGFGTEPTLYAALQDANIYTTVLNNEQVAALANGSDPLGDLPTTTTESLATRPPTTIVPATHEKVNSNRIWGLPMSLVIVLGALIVLIAALSVTFSVRNAHLTSSQDEEEIVV